MSVFRTRLIKHKQERYAFDRLLSVAREEGFLADKVTLLSDTTNVKGAGAIQDTYTLLRKGIRKLLKTMGYHLPGKRQGCSAEIEKFFPCPFKWFVVDSCCRYNNFHPERRSNLMKQVNMVIVNAWECASFRFGL